MHPTLVKRLILATLAVAVAPLAAQTDPDSNQRDRFNYYPQVFFTPPVAESTSVPSTKEGDDWLELDTVLLPGRKSRFFRSLSFSASLVDQENCIEDKSSADPSPLAALGICSELESGSGEVRTFRLNPDDHLLGFEGTITPGDWFRNADDFTKAYSLAKTYDKYVNVEVDPLKGMNRRREKLHFLTWGRGKRLALSLSGTVKYAERKSVVDGARLPRQMLRDEHFEDTYSVEFEPNRLLFYPGDLATAYKALLAHTKLSSDNTSGLDVKQCTTKDGKVDCVAAACRDSAPGDLLDCLKTLSDRPVSPRWLSALLPKIKYEDKDQFDFLLNGGNFVPLAFLEDSIQTWTVSWDLGAALDTAHHRREALTAIATHQKLVEQDAKRKLTIEILTSSINKRAGRSLSKALLARYNDDSFVDASWSAVWLDGTTERKLTELDLHLNTKPGVVLGEQGPPRGSYLIKLKAKDAFGNQAERTVTLRVI